MATFATFFAFGLAAGFRFAATGFFFAGMEPLGESTRDLRLGVEIDVERRHVRPGEQEYFGKTLAAVDVDLVRDQLVDAGFTILSLSRALGGASGLGAGALALVAAREATSLTLHGSGGPWHALYVGS
jgi:hypothetical protein